MLSSYYLTYEELKHLQPEPYGIQAVCFFKLCRHSEVLSRESEAVFPMR